MNNGRRQNLRTGMLVFKRKVSYKEILGQAHRFTRPGCADCVGKGWHIVDDIQLLCECLRENETGRKILEALEKYADDNEARK